MDTTSSTEIADQLRAWARGSLPCQAAVEFVLATGTDVAPMVRNRWDGRPYLDLDVDDEEWGARVGWMSSGQRATWELARSIVAGELYEWYWRLDLNRKAAFALALGNNAL